MLRFWATFIRLSLEIVIGGWFIARAAVVNEVHATTIAALVTAFFVFVFVVYEFLGFVYNIVGQALESEFPEESENQNHLGETEGDIPTH